MGQKCEKCPTAVTSSVITFSDDLVMKLTEDIEPVPMSHEELKNRTTDDYEWIEKLQCIDNEHTHAYGLSIEQFTLLVNKLEAQLAKYTKPKSCEYENVIKCYKRYPECTLACAKSSEQYINCVEGSTVALLVKRLDEHKPKVGTKGKKRCVPKRGKP